MKLEEIWQQKSQKELEVAATELTDYTEEAQQIIRAEMRRRGMPEPPLSSVVPQMTLHPSRLQYAGFWRRFFAAFIDGIIIRILGSFAAYGVRLLFIKTTGKIEEATALGGIASILVAWLYYAILESSREQSTLGKEALGIVVTDLDGNRISFGRATGRYFSKWISILTFFIGYILAALTKKRQALHDIIAGTLVIKKSYRRSYY